MKKLAVMAAVLAALSTHAQAFDVAAKSQQSCSVCHANAVAGAPKCFDTAAWEPRLTKGMETLVSSVTNGLNAMPPRDRCRDCTAHHDQQLMNYMSATHHTR